MNKDTTTDHNTTEDRMTTTEKITATFDERITELQDLKTALINKAGTSETNALEMNVCLAYLSAQVNDIINEFRK